MPHHYGRNTRIAFQDLARGLLVLIGAAEQAEHCGALDAHAGRLRHRLVERRLVRCPHTDRLPFGLAEPLDLLIESGAKRRVGHAALQVAAQLLVGDGIDHRFASAQVLGPGLALGREHPGAQRRGWQAVAE